MLNGILFIFSLGLATATQPQTPNIQTDNIRWNATGFTDLISNAMMTIPCQFIGLTIKPVLSGGTDPISILYAISTIEKL
jgi:hypothetical protein